MFARAGALLLFWLAAAPQQETPAPGPRYTQVIVRKQIIIRSIRIGPGLPGTPRTAQPIEWKESRGPKCVPAGAIAAAAMPGQGSVDFILRDRSRIRARLDSACPALDYYYGFYVTPGEDGMVCADRDSVRSRMGGECGIDHFRTLKAVPAH